MILLQCPYVTVSWDEVNKWIFADWHQDAPPETQINISMKNVEFARKYKSSKLLVDTSQISGGIDTAFQKWIGETWLPTVVNAELKAVCFVVPENYLTRFKFYTTLMKYPPEKIGLKLKFYESLDQAVKWLKIQ